MLHEIDLTHERMRIGIEQQWDSIYTMRFIGRDGRVFQESVGTESEYRPTGEEGYVRVSVTASHGAKAWTQPVFLG